MFGFGEIFSAAAPEGTFSTAVSIVTFLLCDEDVFKCDDTCDDIVMRMSSL